jgi:hypothetical protein
MGSGKGCRAAALFFGLWSGRGVCRFADPTRRVAGGEGFLGGFLDGINDRVEIFRDRIALEWYGVLLFSRLGHK